LVFEKKIMKEQQWKKHITIRLSDGFYMYRKVFSPTKDEIPTMNWNAQRNEVGTRINSVETIGWVPGGTTSASRKTEGYLNQSTYNKPAVQLSMTQEYLPSGPDKKSLVGVATPARPIPSDVSTPISLRELNKYLALSYAKSANEKANQFPSPHLGPNPISLARRLLRDARKAQKRKRRRERREEKRKKRRKVITKYHSINIPNFPLPPVAQLRRDFALTKEARQVTSDPKTSFIHLTNMIVGAQKASIKQVYSDDGPFAFIAKACVTTLDLFREKMVAKSEDFGIAKFSLPQKLPRKLELENALKCIKERHGKLSAEVRTMEELQIKIAGGGLEALVSKRVYPLPQPVPEIAVFAKEEHVWNENLQRSHSAFSEIVIENLTTKLTKRRLLFEEELRERQKQQSMSEMYNREIVSAGIASVRSIMESLVVILKI